MIGLSPFFCDNEWQRNIPTQKTRADVRHLPARFSVNMNVLRRWPQIKGRQYMDSHKNGLNKLVASRNPQGTVTLERLR